MHREGIEPSSIRLKDGGSTIELPVRDRPRAPGRIRTFNQPFRRGPLFVPLSYRCKIIRTVFFAPPWLSPFMHPAGFEPASDRLRTGHSSVELRVPRLPRSGRVCTSPRIVARCRVNVRRGFCSPRPNQPSCCLHARRSATAPASPCPPTASLPHSAHRPA
jgi:hypothetical protein